jgi:hypothetical protein
MINLQEMSPALGVGMGDLQLAASREINRLMREFDGDLQKMELHLITRMHDLELISEDEVGTLSKISEIGFASANDQIKPEKAYLQVRQIYDEMLASGKSSPVALVSASSAAGSYVAIEDDHGEPTIVYKKKGSNNWEGKLASYGAVIGTVIGGAGGGLLGGAIGGIVGATVDACTDGNGGGSPT